MMAVRQVLDTLAALPIIGVLVDITMTFFIAIRTAFSAPSDTVPFVREAGALPGALKAFSAGLLLYATIGGLTRLFFEAPSRVAVLERSIDVPSDMEQKLFLFLLYATFAFAIYYILSAFKWRILDPLAATVLSFYAAAFLLPIRGLSEALVWIANAEVLRNFEATDDMRQLETLPGMVLLIQAIFVLPVLLIAHRFFLVWLARAYSVGTLVMLSTLIASALISAFGVTLFIRFSAQVPEKIIAALSLLS